MTEQQSISFWLMTVIILFLTHLVLYRLWRLRMRMHLKKVDALQKMNTSVKYASYGNVICIIIKGAVFFLDLILMKIS